MDEITQSAPQKPHGKMNLFAALDQNYVSIRAAAKLAGIGLSTLYKLYRKSKIDGATLYNNVIYIPRKWIKENSVPPGYVSISAAAALAHVAVNTIVNHVKSGKLSQIKTTVPIRWSTKFICTKDKKWNIFVQSLCSERIRVAGAAVEAREKGV